MAQLSPSLLIHISRNTSIQKLRNGLKFCKEIGCISYSCYAKYFSKLSNCLLKLQAMVNAAGICSMKAENTLPAEDNESLNSVQKSVYEGEKAEQWLRATSPPKQHSSTLLGAEGILI